MNVDIVIGFLAGSVLVGLIFLVKDFRAPSSSRGSASQEARSDAPAPPTHFSGMNLERWRESRELVEYAQALAKDKRFHLAMEVLQSQLPYPSLSRESDHAAQVGRINGYREAMQVLLELGKAPLEPLPEVPLDYSGNPLGFAEEETTT